MHKRSTLDRIVYQYGKRVTKIWPTYPSRLLITQRFDGRPVVLIHNPKAAGTSLNQLFHRTKKTHGQPRLLLTKAQWTRAFTICSVREPFARFVSGYGYHVEGPYQGDLVKRFGNDLKSLDPFEYFDFIVQFPEKLGPQVDWAFYGGDQRLPADLILKVEESDHWGAKLRDAGFELPDQKVPRKNVGQRKSQIYTLSQADLAALKKRVADYYRSDYEAFGYAY